VCSGDGAFSSAVIHAGANADGGEIRIVYGDLEKEIEVRPERSIKLTRADLIRP